MKKLGTLIFGALIGALAALLLSPKRGQEWRDELTGKLKDQAKNIGVPTACNAATADLFNSVKDKGTEWIGEAGEHLHEMKESASQKIGEVKEEASAQAEVVSAEVSEEDAKPNR